MANRLTMAEIDRILTLHTTEHSNREIARLLGVNRETVGKYVAWAKAQNQPNAPSGTEVSNGGLITAVQNQPNAPPGSNGSANGPPSECEPFHAPTNSRHQGHRFQRCFPLGVRHVVFDLRHPFQRTTHQQPDRRTRVTMPHRPHPQSGKLEPRSGSPSTEHILTPNVHGFRVECTRCFR